MKDIFCYVDQNRKKYLDQLFTLLSQPSISAQDLGVDECAQLLVKMLEASGAEAQIFETHGHPIIVGEIRNPGATRTLLVYGHYDVQPPDPLDLWRSPPFEPVIRDGRIYGRGAADNKGQLFAHIKAAEAILLVRGKTACNVKFLFEGEEEISSPNLGPFILNHKDLLRADACLISDGPKHESGHPTIACGLKGMLYVELRAKGANRDLHSMRAAMIPSPAWRLVHALASLKDGDGRISIEGFYDSVRKPKEEELEVLHQVPPQATVVRKELEIKELIGGDDAYYSNMVFSPTCNIAGIQTGYTGQGVKTVLPCEAFAKIDFRLVPDQNPQDVLRQLEQHLEAQGFADIEVVKHSDLMPSRTPLNNWFVQLVTKAIRDVTQYEPVIFPNLGGSGPDYLFTGVLGLPSVWLPISPHDSNNHAPNENILVKDFLEGIKLGATIMERMR